MRLLTLEVQSSYFYGFVRAPSDRKSANSRTELRNSHQLFVVQIRERLRLVTIPVEF